MKKDLIIHLRLKGRALKDIAAELEMPISVVHLYFKKYVNQLVKRWSSQSSKDSFSFDNAYTDFDTWCSDNGYTPITIKDFKSAICMLENSCDGDLLNIDHSNDGVDSLILDIDKVRVICA